jgi:hypothetical protein
MGRHGISNAGTMAEAYFLGIGSGVHWILLDIACSLLSSSNYESKFLS